MVSKKLASSFKKIALVGFITATIPFAKNTMAHASKVRNTNNNGRANAQLMSQRNNTNANSNNSEANEYALPSNQDISNALIRYQNRVLTQRSQNLAQVVSHKAAMIKQDHETSLVASTKPVSSASANLRSSSMASVSMSASASSSEASVNSSATSQEASSKAARHLAHLAEYYTDVFINMYDQSDYQDLNHFVLNLADEANRNHLSRKVDISFSPANSSANIKKPVRAKNNADLIRFNAKSKPKAMTSSSTTSTVKSVATSVRNMASSAKSASISSKSNSSMAYNATAHTAKHTAGQKEFNRIVSKAATGLSQIASHFTDHNANHKIFKRMFALAKTKLGDRYVWGATGTYGTFDCSGFTQYLYMHSAHHLLPRTAEAQYDDTKRIPESEAHLGDLVFFGGSPYNIEHVGLYLGHGMMIDAQLRGVVIEHVHASWWNLVGFGHVKLN